MPGVLCTFSLLFLIITLLRRCFYYHFSFGGAQKVSNRTKVMYQIKRQDLDVDLGLADAESSPGHASLMCDSICDVEVCAEKV